VAFNEDTSGVDRNVPAAAAGANNGTSPPAPVVAGNSCDERGSLTFGSGSTPAAGAQVVVSFVRPQDPNRLPVVQITETTTALAAINPAVTSVTSAGFTVSTNSAPTASQAATVYGVAWALIP
jgi:hypothetical protein